MLKRIFLSLFTCCILFTSNAQTITQFPYVDGFEDQDSTLWTGSGDWERGFSQKNSIPGPARGNSAWVTQLFSSYSPNSFSQLISPYFDLRQLKNPYIAFYTAYEFERCCDRLIIEYLDDNNNWLLLPKGSYSSGYFSPIDGSIPFPSNTNGFYFGSTNSLDSIQNIDSTRFRFLFQSDYIGQFDGFSIDDFVLADRDTAGTLDLQAIYAGLEFPVTSSCESNSIGFFIQNNSSSSLATNKLRLNYQLNNNPVITETAFINQFSPYSIYFHEFSNLPNASGTLKVWLTYVGDTLTSNDTIEILYNPPTINDLALTETWKNFNRVCQNLDSLGIVVENYYQNQLPLITASFQVDDGNIITDTFPNVRTFCPSQNSNFFKFSKGLGLQSDGTYKIKMWLNNTTDINTENDTLVIDYEYVQPSNLPYRENFDGLNPIDDSSRADFELPTSWFTTPDMAWETRNNGALTKEFGPESGYGGSGNYLYFNPNKTINVGGQITSNCINVPSTNQGVRLEFNYHLFQMLDRSNSIYRFSILDENGNRLLSNFFDSFGTIGNKYSPWKRFSILLNQFKGQSIRLSFELISGINSTPAFAIDNISIYEIIGNTDLSLTINSPVERTCGIPTDSTIQVTVNNLGQTAVTNYEICYTINGGNEICQPIGGGVLDTGGLDVFNLNQKADFKVGRKYLIEAYVKNDADSITQNDTFKVVFENTAKNIAFSDNFEAFSEFDGNWTSINKSGEFTWLENTGFTPTSQTGPISDADGNIEGKYVYAEHAIQNTSSADSVSMQFNSCFDLTTTSNSILEFDYHMLGNDIGGLFIYGQKNGDTLLLDSIIGQQQQSSSDGWETKRVTIDTLYGSVISFSLLATKKQGTDKSDIAIDNFRVRDTTTSISEVDLQRLDFDVYPNPTSGLFNIENENLINTQIAIFSIEGKKLFDKRIINSKTILNLSAYESGIYIVEISSKNKQIRKKLILQK